MANISVTAQTLTELSPTEAFRQFCDGELLGVECSALTVGAAIALSLPVDGDGPAGGANITVLGHVATIRPGRMVVVVHHQPWAGRLIVRFLASAQGTRIVLESQLDDHGIDWLVRSRGYSLPNPFVPGRHRIGLLLSKSGSAAVFAQATEALARLAVDEVNAQGGVGSMPLDLQIGDDASSAAHGAFEARRLARSGCRAIFACVTSATFNAAAKALRGSPVLLVHTVLNEGGPTMRNVVRLAERPSEQLRAGVPALMAETNASRWFFVGQSYSWSFGAHLAARRVVAESGGSVVGEQYLDLGSTDFSEVIERIERCGADLVLSSLVGHDEVFFERQFARSGLRERIRTLALVLDEATLQLIGDEDANGVWTAFGYLQNIDDAANRSLAARYREHVGPLLPPMTSLTETTYEAVLAYARAANRTPRDAPDGVKAHDLEAAVQGRADEGSVGHRQLLHQPIYLAESRGGQLWVRDRIDR